MLGVVGVQFYRLGGNMVQIMNPLHNYANSADCAKWCILGGKMVQICNRLCNMVHFRWERGANYAPFA